MSALKSTLMAWLERVVRRQSSTYRWMQREESASIARKSARTGNVWSDLYRGVMDD